MRGSAAAALTILSRLDMSQAASKKAFATDLEKYQGRLNLLQRKAEQKGVSTILVFEGLDAAGKGGAIRRVTGALDARSYQSSQSPRQPTKNEPTTIFGASGVTCRARGG